MTKRPSRVSGKEEEILELLMEHQKLYGLEMVAKSNSLKRGTIYVTLNRLEDKGLVKSREVQPKKGARGPARRVYSITMDGKRVAMAVRDYAKAVMGVQF